MKKSFILLFASIVFSACTSSVTEANYDIIPLPNSIIAMDGKVFTLNEEVRIVYSKENDILAKNAFFLREYIKASTGLKLKIEDYNLQNAANCIILKDTYKHSNKEAYCIRIDSLSIEVDGASGAGVFYACQFLRKSMPAVAKNHHITFPVAEIIDFPRFAYRGMMYDVARHFSSLEEVKKRIDIMALHNLNRLHWHLTDDQGWRIEIKKYPKLTEIGSYRPNSIISGTNDDYDDVSISGFYTQEEIKEVVAYAAERFITIIPEIDLPGHMVAALAAYPELGCTGEDYEVRRRWGIADEVLCAGRETTMTFLEDVLSEIVELFPSEYIHIGGDECPKKCWKECSYCQAKIKALNIKSDKEHTAEEYLQSYIIKRVEKYLADKGRKIIGWDEILEGGLSKTATVMSWRGVEGGIKAAKLGNNVIMTPNSHLYFDYYQTMDIDAEPFYQIGGYVSTEKVYSFDPALNELTEKEQKRILGVQANLWTEYLKTEANRDYMLLPRLAALSEIAWTAPEKKNWTDFLKRLTNLFAIYERENWNTAKHLMEVGLTTNPNMETGTVDISLATLGSASIYYSLDGSEPTLQSNLYKVPFAITPNQIVKAVTVAKSGWRSKVNTFAMKNHKAALKPIRLNKLPHPKYTYNGGVLLVDGLLGKTIFSSGKWLGFYDNPLEATIDLKEATTISNLRLETLVDTENYIFDAKSITVEISQDNRTFKEIAKKELPKASERTILLSTHLIEFAPILTRYVRVKAVPCTLPKWHYSSGEKAFLFVGEILID
ncbi:MAG: glycoside hydrolase family 20 protein [Bacteroidales bacterium]